ncbi:DUF6119 family protein [Nocardia abscessus]|uniref:DUF6119 family protein n=1 Tax=Nocardia abscessus TaxID=120957 RepID=UPI002456E1E5|nr:DUF6119 family protein [Nocardia abscessus]
MDLNIFKIRRSEVTALHGRLKEKGAESVHAESGDAWHSEFFFLEGEEQVASWLRTYEPFFGERELPTRKSQSAVYLFYSDVSCYAIVHGFGRFHVAPFCDYDFGIELAKRIANKDDVGETGAKRYEGSRRKERRSYRANTALDTPSGESVDFIGASIIDSKKGIFGPTGRFGVSAILSPRIKVDGIADMLSAIDVELAGPELFTLPGTVPITEPTEVGYFDSLLVKEITSENGETYFASRSFDLCGVDFTFGRPGKFSIKHPRKRSLDFLDNHTLSMDDLRSYIQKAELTGNEILKIKITTVDDEGNCLPDIPLKNALDYIADADRVVLLNGKWRHFNQDYLAFLDDYVRSIETEEPEDAFKIISTTETEFNDSHQVRYAGYKSADKDFSIAQIRARTPVEAWDLSRVNTVYAVKFGTPQKLGYVCDQAENLLKLVGKRATTKDIPGFERYCLWFGYAAKRLPGNVADTNSVILKQKIESWARVCRDYRVTPVIKLSKHIRAKRQLTLF